MRVAITGSTGLVGTILTKHLRGGGHEVTRVVRSYGGLPPGERAVIWHPDDNTIDAEGLERHDAVVHLAGESIAGVWTEGKKRRIRESRVRGTTLLARTLAGLDRPPHTLISASSFDIYGDRPRDEVLDEDSAPGTGFLPDIIAAWEASTGAAGQAGIRVVHTRFGNVLSPDGGMLAVLLPFYRLGLGTRFGSGEQYWPWISVDEIPPAMVHVLDRPDIRGPVNFVAPEQVTNAEFNNTIAAVVGRRSFLRVPAFAARLAPGHMAEHLLLRSARVAPARLLESGYTFRHPDLRGALRSLLR
jgi:uncharacterized protein